MIFIPVGLIFSAIGGCIFPVFGIFWGKILFVMQPDLLNPDKRIDLTKINEYAFIMLGLGFISFFTIFINRSLWGILA